MSSIVKELVADLLKDEDQLDELSKRTLGSYVTRSASSMAKAHGRWYGSDVLTVKKRAQGLRRAVTRLER